jgi:hypothetical protein
VTDSEQLGERFREWAKSQPQCIGGEAGCDGSLVGESHEDNCPLSKIPGMEGRWTTITPWDAWQASGREAQPAPTLEMCAMPKHLTCKLRNEIQIRMVEGCAREAANPAEEKS